MSAFKTDIVNHIQGRVASGPGPWNDSSTSVFKIRRHLGVGGVPGPTKPMKRDPAGAGEIDDDRKLERMEALPQGIARREYRSADQPRHLRSPPCGVWGAVRLRCR